MTEHNVGLGSGEVCKRSGATYRQLDYWANCGYLQPSIRPAQGSGSSRAYSEDDVVIASALVALSRLREQFGAVAEMLRSGERRFTVSSASVRLTIDIDAKRQPGPTGDMISTGVVPRRTESARPPSVVSAPCC